MVPRRGTLLPVYGIDLRAKVREQKPEIPTKIPTTVRPTMPRLGCFRAKATSQRGRTETARRDAAPQNSRRTLAVPAKKIFPKFCTSPHVRFTPKSGHGSARL